MDATLLLVTECVLGSRFRLLTSKFIRKNENIIKKELVILFIIIFF